MSRGWESKSVEEQQSMAGMGSGTGSGDEKPVADRVRDALMDANRKRERQALELQRERVLSERTSSPHRRTALETALIDIEEKLSELGWTIHL